MKLTIVTVVYNAKEDIYNTLESIKMQNNQKFEYLVIDGGSTDGTLDVIKDSFRVDNYVSEKDNGIYDAMNKGIKLSKGDMIIFLNAGDVFYDDNVVDKITKIKNYEEFDVIYGDVVMVNNKKRLKRQPDILSLSYLYTNNLCHQSMIFNKKSFQKIGLFDINEKVFADYKWLIRAYSRKSKFYHLNSVVCEYDNMNGVSSKINKLDLIKTRGKIVKEICGTKKLIEFIIANLLLKPFSYLDFYFNKKNIV